MLQPLAIVDAAGQLMPRGPRIMEYKLADIDGKAQCKAWAVGWDSIAPLRRRSGEVEFFTSPGDAAEWCLYLSWRMFNPSGEDRERQYIRLDRDDYPGGNRFTNWTYSYPLGP